jgi:hypothetical protein
LIAIKLLGGLGASEKNPAEGFEKKKDSQLTSLD